MQNQNINEIVFPGALFSTEDRKVYRCQHPLCTKAYVKKHTLLRHVRKHHEGIVNTHICQCGGKVIDPYKSNLERHYSTQKHRLYFEKNDIPVNHTIITKGGNSTDAMLMLHYAFVGCILIYNCLEKMI